MKSDWEDPLDEIKRMLREQNSTIRDQQEIVLDLLLKIERLCNTVERLVAAQEHG